MLLVEPADSLAGGVESPSRMATYAVNTPKKIKATCQLISAIPTVAKITPNRNRVILINLTFVILESSIGVKLIVIFLT